MNSTTCNENCTSQDYRMPYFYEIDSVLDQLFENGSINATDYPIFTDHVSDMRHRSSTENEYQREFKFYISAKYNFETRMWTSGGFEIKENYWAERNENEPKYPILNDRLFLVRNYFRSSNHFRAVYCGDDLGEKEFKVTLWCQKFYQLTFPKNVHEGCQNAPKLL